MSTHTGVGAYAVNRGQLIDAIRRAGQVSRVELVHRMGSNAATVSTAVRSLIDDGLVVEVGRAASTGGKPAVLLSLVPDARFALGVSLDHSGISYVVANLGGAVVGRLRRRGAGADTPAAVVERIGTEMMSLVTHVGATSRWPSPSRRAPACRCSSRTTRRPPPWASTGRGPPGRAAPSQRSTWEPGSVPGSWSTASCTGG